MNGLVSKKPKIEIVIEEDEDNNCKANKKTEEKVNQDDVNEQVRKKQVEALIALIQHRTKEVEYLRTRLAYYKSQLEEAEKRLEDAQLILACSRSRKSISTANNSLRNSLKDIKREKSTSPSHEHVGEGSSSLINQPKPKVLCEVATLSKNSDGLEGRSAGISTAKNLSGNSIKEIELEKGLPSPTPVHESTPVKLNHSKPHPAREAVDSSRNSEGLGSGSASPSEHNKSFSQSQPACSKSQLSMKPNQPVNTYDSKSGASSTSPNPQSNISSSFHGSGMVKQEADLRHRKSPKQEAIETQAKGMKRKLATSKMTTEKPCCAPEKDSHCHQRVQLHHLGLHILRIEATMMKMESSKSMHFVKSESSQVNQVEVRDFDNLAMYGRSYVRRRVIKPQQNEKVRAEVEIEPPTHRAQRK